MAGKKGLTKDEHTIAEHRLKTNDGKYSLYVQEWGNRSVAPILYLHGGPGAGCSNKHKRLYDPQKHRVVFFDQRGAGNSTPKGRTKDNNTQKLVDDIKLIKLKLGIKKWSVHGGSWGSTLALCYAIDYPKDVTDMILRGVFLGSTQEIDWFERGGYRIFFPEVWEYFIKGVPKKYLDNPGAYHREQIQKHRSKKSAYIYTEAESQVIPLDHRFQLSEYEEYDISYAKIISHYMGSACFLKPDYIINNAGKLTMPIYIVQGRYDMVCLPQNAYALQKALPNSKLHWALAGHSGSDRSIYDITKTLINLIY